MKKISLLFLIFICLASCQKSQDEIFVGTDISSAHMNAAFKLRDFNGRTRTLEDFRGKVIVLFLGLLIALIYALQP